MSGAGRSEPAGADVDDRAAAGGHHALADQRRQPERALEVQVHDRVEQLLGHRRQRVVERRHARVVDQHVDLAEPVVGGVDQSVELIPPPDVHLVREGGPAGRRRDLLGRDDARFEVAAGDDDVGAASGCAEGHLASQPAAASGDEHHPSVRSNSSSAYPMARLPSRAMRAEPYGVTVQLLLVRHALPLRSEAGQGSDPDLSAEGIEQAKRLPDALARFPITRLVSSPQRRALQTGAAGGRRAGPDRSTSTSGSPSTTTACRTTRRSRRPREEDLQRLIERPSARRRRRGRVHRPGQGRRRRHRRGRRPRRHRRGVQPRRRHQRAGARPS